MQAAEEAHNATTAPAPMFVNGDYLAYVRATDATDNARRTIEAAVRLAEAAARSARIDETIARVIAMSQLTPPPTPSPPSSVAPAASLACERCARPFSTQRSLTRHQRRASCIAIETAALGQAQNAAKRSLGRSTKLLDAASQPPTAEAVHIAALAARTCNGCQLTFASLRTLRVHVRRQSCRLRERTLSARRRLACDRCGRAFASQRQLNAHRQRAGCEPPQAVVSAPAQQTAEAIAEPDWLA